MKEECKKVEEWILDPGHTVGGVSLYEKTVALFWVMKNLVCRVAWDRHSKDTGGSSPNPWKVSISASVQRVKAKVDFLISCLGFQFPSSSLPEATKPNFLGTSQGGGQDLSYILL